MQTVDFEATIPLSCRDAFNLASDWKAYTDFMPMLKSVEMVESSAQSAKMRFIFDLDGTLGTLAKTLGIAKSDQLSKIEWKDEREMSAESIQGPLKSIFMRCRFEPVASDRTKIKLNMKFETGMGWLADKAALLYIKSQGTALINNIDAELKAVLDKRSQRAHSPA